MLLVPPTGRHLCGGSHFAIYSCAFLAYIEKASREILKKRDLLLAFVDLKKAFDRVLIEAVCMVGTEIYGCRQWAYTDD